MKTSSTVNTATEEVVTIYQLMGEDAAYEKFEPWRNRRIGKAIRRHGNAL